MDLVLRKRISLNIYKRQSITERLKKSKWLGRADLNITQTGVTYEVVSNIPKASEELEDRESLAQLAASGEDNSACDGETYIGMSLDFTLAIDFRQRKTKYSNFVFFGSFHMLPLHNTRTHARTYREIYARCVSCREYSNIGSIAAKCCNQRARTESWPIIVNAKDC